MTKQDDLELTSLKQEIRALRIGNDYLKKELETVKKQKEKIEERGRFYYSYFAAQYELRHAEKHDFDECFSEPKDEVNQWSWVK